MGSQPSSRVSIEPMIQPARAPSERNPQPTEPSLHGLVAAVESRGLYPQPGGSPPPYVPRDEQDRLHCRGRRRSTAGDGHPPESTDLPANPVSPRPATANRREIGPEDAPAAQIR